jgi:hypothetical protein
MRRKTACGPERDIDWYTIHEVFYGEDGSLSWTEDEIAPAGESVDELRETLQRMIAALEKPVLDYDAEKDHTTNA